MKKSELRNLIREEILKEYSKNWYPPKDSNWYEFAKAIQIGTMDLDNFAYYMGFRDFKELDISIGPRSLHTRNKKKFVNAIRKSSIMASDMSAAQIAKIVDKTTP